MDLGDDKGVVGWEADVVGEETDGDGDAPGDGDADEDEAWVLLEFMLGSRLDANTPSSVPFRADAPMQVKSDQPGDGEACSV